MSKVSKIYSFDIFDTLIQRASVEPVSIFVGVRDYLRQSTESFSTHFVENYPEIRMNTEKTVREYYKKSKLYRHSDKIEISFDLIFERMQSLYSLTSQQVAFLKAQEIDLEIQSVILCSDIFNKLQSYVSSGHQVILISDMYLPKEVIRQMLEKANPLLNEVPLFLSSEAGYQKSTGDLFRYVKSELNIDYQNWTHFGDNKLADINVPSKLGIQTEYCPKINFNHYEQSFIKKNNSYDGYLVAGLFLRHRMANDLLISESAQRDYFVYAYISQYFVPYIMEVLKKAERDSIDQLYFISRDGYFLKKVADAVIKERQLNIKTKYLYGSRVTWRVPSYIDAVDEEFFSEFGNLIASNNYLELIKNLDLEEDEVLNLFPEFKKYKNKKQFSAKDKSQIIEKTQQSKAYQERLIEGASEERQLVTKYLRQEINSRENFAFVEYWGRGYTQTCLAKLIDHSFNESLENVFFYARSIYPSQGKLIRHNLTASPFSLTFVESLFSNLPYHTIQEYASQNDGTVYALINDKAYDEPLFETMNRVLPLFISDYCRLKLMDEEYINRQSFDFSIEYFKKNQKDPMFIRFFSTLKDSLRVGEKEVAYAPALKMRYLLAVPFKGRRSFKTNSMQMSIEKSSPFTKTVYKVAVKLYKLIK